MMKVYHGITLDDPYAWLRAENWREVMRDPSVLDPKIRTWLDGENAQAAAGMADTQAFQETLYKELRGRVKEDDSGVPAPDGPFAYFFQYESGAEHPRYCRQKRDGGPVEILLDGRALSAGMAFFRFGSVSHSPDHGLIAYGFDAAGGEYYTIKIRDIASGEELADEIVHTTGSMVWANDGRTLFYVWNDDRHQPCRVYAHVLGTPAESDVLVYEEKDQGFFVGIGETQSRKFIRIQAHDHETSEVYLIDADAPQEAPRLVAARDKGVEYSVGHRGGDLVILTNADGAEDFKIVTAPVAAPRRENWRDLVAHDPGRFILGMETFRDHLVRLERFEGLPRIIIRDWATGTEHSIHFDEEAYALGFGENLEFDTTALRFSYSSMTTPAQAYDYDMADRSRVLRKTQEVPSGHDPAQYVTRRVMAPADDGELVPVSILYRKDTPLNGSAPCLLYGYGAYGMTIPAAFNANWLSLVDRGFVYALAHIRGGKDKGYRWYAQGKRLNKKNSFTDFIAAGRFLARERFTSEGKIVALGGSAGGMLMGAVANMAPDLFRGIIAEVPFVDVLNTMLDPTLPLTPPEWPEWGNPIESAEDFAYIASYSPYDNVAAQAYPHLLALAGLADPRVTYWEPAKWVAKLRDLRTNDALLLFKTNMEAGHAGAAGRFDRLKEVALIYAFACKITDRIQAMPESGPGVPS
ncbi:oligopeptidase B [Rhodoligotrophos appendicifer]|uniref:S9 family peptidase n=1 Tax=Rhodoligotrophos appendicifer TaxID=987056 RepID=UPI00118512C4|nr:S9 family peptidase [Rhodoligotrophos appendicifer]